MQEIEREREKEKEHMSVMCKGVFMPQRSKDHTSFLSSVAAKAGHKQGIPSRSWSHGASSRVGWTAAVALVIRSNGPLQGYSTSH